MSPPSSRRSLPPNETPLFSLQRAPTRLAYALIAGVAVFVALRPFGVALRLVAAWDVTAFVLLTFAWIMIWRATPEYTRRRAGSEDPGRTVVWILMLMSSSVSIFAAGVVLRQAKSLAGGYVALWITLCLTAVVVSWLLSQTSWTLRYAHLYYRGDAEGQGGLTFPSDGENKEDPDDFDFAYFAFTIGLCFQVSDVTICSRQIRRAVLFHACQSFAYNTAIVALALNLAFGFLT